MERAQRFCDNALCSNYFCAGLKEDVSIDEIEAVVAKLLLDIHTSMFEKAKRERDDHVIIVREWKDFVPALEKHCLVLTPFCDQKEWEEKVKVS